MNNNKTFHILGYFESTGQVYTHPIEGGDPCQALLAWVESGKDLPDLDDLTILEFISGEPCFEFVTENTCAASDLVSVYRETLADPPPPPTPHPETLKTPWDALSDALEGVGYTDADARASVLSMLTALQNAYQEQVT